MAREKIQDRINEQSPWQHITEGNKIFEAATSKDFAQGSGGQQRPPGSLKSVNNVFCAHQYVQIRRFQS